MHLIQHGRRYYANQMNLVRYQNFYNRRLQALGEELWHVRRCLGEAMIVMSNGDEMGGLSKKIPGL